MSRDEFEHRAEVPVDGRSLASAFRHLAALAMMDQEEHETRRRAGHGPPGSNPIPPWWEMACEVEGEAGDALDSFEGPSHDKHGHECDPSGLMALASRLLWLAAHDMAQIGTTAGYRAEDIASDVDYTRAEIYWLRVHARGEGIPWAVGDGPFKERAAVTGLSATALRIGARRVLDRLGKGEE